jgi:hypothetical protein
MTNTGTAAHADIDATFARISAEVDAMSKSMIKENNIIAWVISGLLLLQACALVWSILS